MREYERRHHEFLSVSSVGSVKDEERRTFESSGQRFERLLRLLLLCGDELGAGTRLESFTKSRQTVRQLGEVVLTVEEGTKIGLDLFRIEFEYVATTRFGGRIPSVKRPSSDFDSLLGLLEDFEGTGRIGLSSRQVGEDDRRTLVSIGFSEGAKGLSEVSVDSNRCDVSVSISHRVETGILSSILRGSGQVGRKVVRGSVDHEEVDIGTSRESVVKSGSAEIVRPSL